MRWGVRRVGRIIVASVLVLGLGSGGGMIVALGKLHILIDLSC